MNKNSKVAVLGASGMVGSAIMARLHRDRYNDVLAPDFDLTSGPQTELWFIDNPVDYVFLAAARVGGIQANANNQYRMLLDNLLIEANVLRHVAYQSTAKTIFLGSSCIYPRDAEQPITEDALLTGPLEPTNEGYALAKIAGVYLCKHHPRNAVAAMPCNLYGPNDNYSESAHVLPALIRRFHEAKVNDTPEVICWGTGKPLREFLHVDDLADALMIVAKEYNHAEPINIGSGEEISIYELSHTIADIVGYKGDIKWDESKPDGTPRKLLDSTKMRRLGWEPQISLRDGIRDAYEDFQQGARL